MPLGRFHDNINQIERITVSGKERLKILNMSLSISVCEKSFNGSFVYQWYLVFQLASL